MRGTLLWESSQLNVIDTMAGMQKPWLGRSMPRVEDARFVTGRGSYVDDLLPQGCLFLEFVRSPYPHGTLVTLDLEDARQADGVVAVFSASDLSALGDSSVNIVFPDMAVRPIKPLAGERVEAAGQAVAAIVATSLACARDAAQRVDMEVEPLPAANGTGGTAIFTHQHQTGDVEAAFANAAYRISASVEHSLLAPTPLEPRASLATWDDGQLTAWVSTQAPYRVREDLARILGLPMSQVRVISPDVGGAFGGKSSIYPEDIVVSWASRHLGAPVKWCATRGEELLAATQGRGAKTKGELALSADGRLLALRAQLSFPVGHWMPFSAAIPGRNASRILPGPYKVPAVDIDLKGYVANQAAIGIYRGAGRPEAAMLMERLMDEAARQLSIDPITLRRLNVIEPSAFPYATPTNETLDSGNYPALIEKIEDCTAYDALRVEQSSRREAGEVVGIGIGLYIEPCGQGWESADVSLCRNGSVLVATGASAQGQGRETAFAQIAADALATTPDKVRVKQGDTAELSSGIGALASRSTAIGGSAVLRACQGLRQQLAEAAAELLQCAAQEIAFGPDRISAGEAPAQSVTWSDLASHIAGHSQGDAPENTQDTCLTSSVVYHADGEAWSSGCCLACVSINQETGEPLIERLAWVDDAGIIVNPLLVRGQLVGGMAQGLGETLMERIVYDADGQLLTGSLMDYALPRATDIPAIHIDKIETPSTANPLGAKGVGEAGCIGIPAAVFNAVSDALAPFGQHNLQMPLTSEKIWRFLQRQSHGRQNEDQQ